MVHRIEIATDFSDVPAGRFDAGELFQREFLVPALEAGGNVTVILDGVEGYGSSFLEEAFGGLIRNCGFQYSDLRQRLQIVAESEEYQVYRDIITQYMEDAARVANQQVA